MRFVDAFFSRADRYSLGREEQSGRHYLSIPVSTGHIDYEEYYALAPEQYDHLLADPEAAIEFAERCRRRELDELLILRPGSNRGSPM